MLDCLCVIFLAAALVISSAMTNISSLPSAYYRATLC